MKICRLLAALIPALLLTGCGSFLNREFSETEPHSATYFESEDRSVLRVETYQDLVNGLLTLVTDRATEGTVWIYPSGDITNPAEAIDGACREVKQETPMGAYAVDYLTYTAGDTAHNYSVFRLTIGYRRTAEQVGAMVHTTSVSALYDLLPVAAESGAGELVLQVGHFDQTQEEVRAAVAQLQLDAVLGGAPELPEEGEAEPAPDEESPAPERALPEDVLPWQVNFYPDSSRAGIVEVLLAY